MKKSNWEEFSKTGLFVFVNSFLHIFGWAIVKKVDKETGKVESVFPARAQWKGFDEDETLEAYDKLHAFMRSEFKSKTK